MKIKRTKEVAVLTAEEYAILEKAHEILSEIYEDCEIDDGYGLMKYASDAKDELEYFLDDGKNKFYEVEEPSVDTVQIILHLK